MSARELLEQAKSLPAEQLREFLEGARALETEETQSPAMQDQSVTKPLKWPDAEARRRRIFGDRILPNLVLAAREEESPSCAQRK